jgi:hypothetical protein
MFRRMFRRPHDGMLMEKKHEAAMNLAIGTVGDGKDKMSSGFWMVSFGFSKERRSRQGFC